MMKKKYKNHQEHANVTDTGASFNLPFQQLGFLSTFPFEKLDHCHHLEVEERYTIIVVDRSGPTSRSLPSSSLHRCRLRHATIVQPRRVFQGRDREHCRSK
nr:uncharacterized protein LOC107417797 [Ziziphus jujuba var. spinosa]